jgi:hypothetical protein
VLETWVPGVPISVEGGAANTFLVDTGAPLTMLDRDDYTDLEDGKHALTLEAFELSFPELDVAVFDVFTYAQDTFSGILGGDVLSNFALSVDYQGQTLWLDDAWQGQLPLGLDPASVGETLFVSADVRGGGRALVPGDCPGGCGTIDIPATRFLVEVEVEDRASPLTLLVDTGASSVVLSPTLMAELGGDTRPRLDGITVGTANGLTTAYFTRVWRLALQGGDQVELSSVPVLVFASDDLLDGLEGEVGRKVDGIVGASFMRNFAVTIDFPGETLALAPYTNLDHIDQNEWVGVGFTMSKIAGQWQVEDVYPGTDAAVAGLTSGDLISEIDGQSTAPLNREQVNAILDAFAVGEAVTLGIDRGATIDVVAVEVEDLLPAYVQP